VSFITVKKSPFSRDEDPKVVMIDYVRREAASRGEPLSEPEVLLLSKESKNVPEETRVRLKALIELIVERERYSDASISDPKSFINSMGWAGDMQYPLVVQLAEEVFCENPGPGEAKGNRFLDKVLLVAAAAMVVLLMFGVVYLLSAVSER